MRNRPQRVGDNPQFQALQQRFDEKDRAKEEAILQKLTRVITFIHPSSEHNEMRRPAFEESAGGTTITLALLDRMNVTFAEFAGRMAQFKRAYRLRSQFCCGKLQFGGITHMGCKSVGFIDRPSPDGEVDQVADTLRDLLDKPDLKTLTVDEANKVLPTLVVRANAATNISFDPKEMARFLLTMIRENRVAFPSEGETADRLVINLAQFGADDVDIMAKEVSKGAASFTFNTSSVEGLMDTIDHELFEKICTGMTKNFLTVGIVPFRIVDERYRRALSSRIYWDLTAYHAKSVELGLPKGYLAIQADSRNQLIFDDGVRVYDFANNFHREKKDQEMADKSLARKMNITVDELYKRREIEADKALASKLGLSLEDFYKKKADEETAAVQKIADEKKAAEKAAAERALKKAAAEKAAQAKYKPVEKQPVADVQPGLTGADIVANMAKILETTKAADSAAVPADETAAQKTESVQ